MFDLAIDYCSRNVCRGQFATCENRPGSYECYCPQPNIGDGHKFCSRMHKIQIQIQYFILHLFFYFKNM